MTKAKACAPRPARAEATSVGQLRSIKQIAAVLGISQRTVRRLIDRGELHAHRVGRSRRISDGDLRVYLASAV